MDKVSNMLKSARLPLFVLTLLSTVGFYNFHDIISEQLVKLLMYVNVGLCLMLGFTEGVSLRDVKFPRIAYALVVGSIAVSAFMASFFHPQGLLVSFMTTLPYLVSYLFFIALMKLDIPREQIIKVLLVLCAISTVVYFCNALTIPHNIFGTPMIYFDMTRGIVRLPVVFIPVFPLLVFYGINRWLLTHERKWLVLIAWCVVMIFLSVIRQIIALTLVLGVWYYFRKVSVWTKIAVVLGVIAVVAFVLPQIPIYKTMIELSEDQRDLNDQTEDIRIQAWRYYTYEYQTNALSPFLGNGVPSYGNSLWGQMFESELEEHRRFAGDVGWAGFFWFFGGIGVFALLYMVLNAIFRRKAPTEQYLTYWLIYLLISSVASGQILYFYEIVIVSMVFYLVYKKPDPDHQDATRQDIPAQEAPPSLLPRYPQL